MKPEYQPDDLLNCRQAAEYAGVVPRTVASWIRKDWLRATKKLPGPRGRYIIKFQDLEDLLTVKFPR